VNINYVPIRGDISGFQFLDQRKLPLEEIYMQCETLDDAFSAIREMVVRGAPLIGFTAIAGLVLDLKSRTYQNLDEFKKTCEYLKTARPTAVNLMYEVDMAYRIVAAQVTQKGSWSGTAELLMERLVAVMKKLENDNLTMAKLAEQRLKSIFGDKKLNLMTLCNTGFLACGPIGTALGVISYMNSIGKVENVYASETRPYMQGIRLTSWELKKEGISHEVVVEGAASHLLKTRRIDAIFIGADRIVANGDTANKVGSSGLSIIADYYGVPFFVVAPYSSFDMDLDSGEKIEIEMRPEEEILFCKDIRLAPEGVRAFNPSFDVTDHKLITSIFCEKGEIHPVSRESMKKKLGV
jgi:methylthioribose-1-phosphate isomerase